MGVDLGFNRIAGYFNEAAHKYSDDKGTVYTSATTFIHEFEKPFDRKYWSEYKAKERGVSVEVILSEWKELNDASLVRGNGIHNALEDGINDAYKVSGEQVSFPSGRISDARYQEPIGVTTIIELRQIKIYNQYPLIRATLEKYIFAGYTIYAEYRLYRPEIGLSGTIDILCVKGNDIVILDWKTNKKPMFFESGYYKKVWKNGVKVETTNFVKTLDRMLAPLNHIPACLGMTYTLQLSLYAYMLSMYGFTIKGLVLFHIQPINNIDYVKYHVLDYRRSDIELMLKHTNRI